jgi:cytosine/adenosine deaminase-related metal-dependent hydrolase
LSFEEEIRKAVEEEGGFWNAHAHLDRALVMDARYVAHADMDPWEIATYPLEVKQHTTGVLHGGPAYTRESLRERLTQALAESARHGVTRIDSFIDTTADGVELRALECALQVKKEFAGKIDFRVGAYPIFGFKDEKPERWEVFREGAKLADFVGTLPERDARKGHIGFREHFRRVLELAHSLGGKEAHFHVDQTNRPEEDGTLTLIEAVRWLRPDPRGHAEKRPPTVWAVHALSVASYSEERFRRVIEGLKETNIGIIVCPSATLSNKQDRRLRVPMHNSITRVLDFLAEDIPVRIGTDNVQDFFLPAGSFDLYAEVFVAANALRFYNYATWAKIATGKKLNEVDKMKIRGALRN